MSEGVDSHERSLSYLIYNKPVIGEIIKSFLV